jgi:putative DNA-invertase from lambdoid prophage Rac
MFRADLYARVSTNDQQTLAMQNRAMREYAARRGWTIALQVREVNSGAAKRSAGEITGRRAPAGDRLRASLAAGSLGPVRNGSAGNPTGTGASRVGFVSLTEALDLTTPAGRAMAGLLAIFAEFEREILRERTRAGLACARENGNGWAGRQPRPYTLRKSGNCTAPVSANPRSLAAFRWAARRYAAS